MKDVHHKRSKVIEIGGLSTLALTFLAGCGEDESKSYCVVEQLNSDRQVIGYQRLPDEACDNDHDDKDYHRTGGHGGTWIVYSNSYPHGYRVNETIKPEHVGNKVNPSDPVARKAAGFTESGKFPRTGGFGRTASGGKGSSGG